MDHGKRMPSFWRWGFLIALGWYLVEVMLHYFMQRPLWNDEACLLISLERFSDRDYFSRTLFSCQTFPRLYLYLIQQFSSFFEHSVLSLRFFPWVAMLMGVVVWVFVARRELKEGKFLFLFMMSWAASVMMVYYGAEFKQYSFDVLAAGVFFLFLQRQRELSFKVQAWVVCLLPLLGLFSYPVFFFLIFPLWNLAAQSIRDIKFRYALVGYLTSCLAVVSFVYYYDLRLSDPTLIHGFRDHFISAQSPGMFWKTLTEGLNNMISRWFADKPLWVRFITRFFMALAVIQMVTGFVKSLKADQWRFHAVGSVALLLLAELIIFSALNIFPFRIPRAILFFCPILFILMLQFLMQLESKWKNVSWVLQSGYGLFLFIMAITITRAAFYGDLPQDLTRWMQG